MHAERHSGPVASLDPESRALVELSLVRGFSDGDLAEVLGVSARRVRERREVALEALGVTTLRGREKLATELRGDSGQVPAAASGTPVAAHSPPADPAPETAEAPAVAAEPAAPEATVAPGSDEPSSRRRRVSLALLGGLMVAVVVALVLAGTESGDPGAPPTADPASDPGGGRTQGGGPGGSAPAGGRLALASPAGSEGGGSASAQVVAREGERRLLLSVRGLATPPGGGYAIWLYNSISDARLLGGSPRGRFRVEVTLPESADRYSFLDVSRELPDGNRNHGGASVLRLRLADLLGG